MKLKVIKHLIKWLWMSINPLVRDEIIVSALTPDLAKSWLSRKPVHQAMTFLSEAVRSVSRDTQHIHSNPNKRPSVTGQTIVPNTHTAAMAERETR